jgi:hypothetical protein
MTPLIPFACASAYIAVALLAARFRYRRIRPWTEPVACETPIDCERHGKHIYDCYRRYSDIDTTYDAVCLALLSGLFWPYAALAKIVRRIITGGDRQLPEETVLKTRRQEAENERLKREQEGAS